jgi:hypothetical protein
VSKLSAVGFVVMAIASALSTVIVYGAVYYVIAHFIRKFW